MNCAGVKKFETGRVGGGGRRAFTLIELLVVVAIIAILAALVTGTFGFVRSKAIMSRAQIERDNLVTAINDFKSKKGQYPPDNPNNPASSPLFYELTGVMVTNPSGTTLVFNSRISQETLTPANVTTLFGRGGFVNSSLDPAEVDNFLPSSAKYSAQFVTNGTLNYTLLGLLSVKGPAERVGLNSKILNAWNYVSTNPTNNPGSYDLWVDVTYGGKIYRFSNWSKDPQPQ